jgi:spoIIIJ-associated protein
MINKHNYENKKQEKLMEDCLADLGLTENDIFSKEVEIESKLFQAKKFGLCVVTKTEVKEFIKGYLNHLSEAMNLDIKHEIKETDGIFNILLVSNNNAILIGRDGRTLESMQLLLRKAVRNQTDFNVKINLDVSNYKSHRDDNLRYEVKKICNDVDKTTIEAKLDPMNSYNRRLAHTVISQFNELESESFGEEPERYVVIRKK